MKKMGWVSLVAVLMGLGWVVWVKTRDVPRAEFSILMGDDADARMNLLVQLSEKPTECRADLFGPYVADMMSQSPSAMVSTGQVLRTLTRCGCNPGVETVNKFNPASKAFDRALCLRIASAARESTAPLDFAAKLEVIAASAELEHEEQFLLSCLVGETRKAVR